MIKQKKGFTLIELLIVVAIIAILAAIAIPNFLQAQVRSKVARAEADMASIAVALESYEVDNDTYPYSAAPIPGVPGVDGWFNCGPWNNWTWNGEPLSLTTPISYLSSGILWDPFPDLNNNQGGAASYRYTCNAQILTEVSNDVQAGDANWYDADNPVGRSIYWSAYGVPNDNVQWVEWSNGPACTDVEGQPTVYDPTNGTVSNGNIYRFGP